MVKQAVFILSFDCEAKWGMADGKNRAILPGLTDKALENAYRALVLLLDEARIKATFAFVAGLTLSAAEYRARRHIFGGGSASRKRWMRAFSTDANRGIYDGWLNPRLLEMVRAVPEHEIASHGFAHLPIGGTGISRLDFEEDIRAAQEVWRLKGVFPKTFVYPRNMVKYTHTLKEFGFIGYRDNLYRGVGIAKNIVGLVNELNTSQRAHSSSHGSDGLVRVPAGYFLNWRYGIRREIPIGTTLRRWRNIIDDGIANKRVVHMWTHPHNYIQGEKQYEILRRILEIASGAIESGKLNNYTMEEYCKHQIED